MGNCFWIYKAGAKLLLFIFQPILKSSDLTGPCYNEQNLSVLSGFVKTRVHRIKRPLFHKIHRKRPVPLALFPIFYTASIFSYTRHTSTKVKEFLIFFLVLFFKHLRVASWTAKYQRARVDRLHPSWLVKGTSRIRVSS